jgi:beta-catenin-like protein 1
MSALELLADNLSRFNESEEADRQGVFQVLGIFENMIALNQEVVVLLTDKTKLMKWLLKRIASPEADANRAYSAELMSILLQQENASRQLFGKFGGVEVVLQVCSVRQQISFF